MFHSISFLTDSTDDDLQAGTSHLVTEDDSEFGRGSFNYTTTGEKPNTRDSWINGKNTWEDWHLIPSVRPNIAMPNISEKYLEIPGRDGSYDLSTWLTSGRPTYSDRTGSLEFYHQNNYEDLETIRRKMANYFHGRKLKMVLEDDPNYYYIGRFKMQMPQADGNFHKITLEYRLEPYKWTVQKQSLNPAVWDRYSLEHDDDYYFEDSTGNFTASEEDIKAGRVTFNDHYATPKVVYEGNSRNFHDYETMKVTAHFSSATGSLTVGNVTKEFKQGVANPMTVQGYSSVHTENTYHDIIVSYTGTVSKMYFVGGLL